MAVGGFSKVLGVTPSVCLAAVALHCHCNACILHANSREPCVCSSTSVEWAINVLQQDQHTAGRQGPLHCRANACSVVLQRSCKIRMKAQTLAGYGLTCRGSGMHPRTLILGIPKSNPATARRRTGGVQMVPPAIHTCGWRPLQTGRLEQLAQCVVDTKSASLLHLLPRHLMWPRSGTLRQIR